MHCKDRARPADYFDALVLSSKAIMLKILPAWPGMAPRLGGPLPFFPNSTSTSLLHGWYLVCCMDAMLLRCSVHTRPWPYKSNWQNNGAWGKLCLRTGSDKNVQAVLARVWLRPAKPWQRAKIYAHIKNEAGPTPPQEREQVKRLISFVHL